MAMEPLTGKLTAAVTGLSTPAGPSPAADGPQFSKALANVASPPLAEVHGARPDPVREAPGAARSPAPGSGLGQQILDSLENLYRSGQSLSRGGVISAPESGLGSANLVMRTTLVAPGPAAAPLMSRPMSEPRPIAATGESNTPDFDAMIRALEQVSTHAIQVSVVSKTTGSFTSSLNKLTSAN
jgi:hypothetical protein